MGFNRRVLLPMLIICFIHKDLSSTTIQGFVMLNHQLEGTENTISGSCDQDFELRKASCRERSLRSVPQYLHEDIRFLDLYDNNITSLLNSSFQRYPLISKLLLSTNDIKLIQPGTFYPLKHLSYLDISRNPHLVLPVGLAIRLGDHLGFRFSNLKSLPNDTLKWTTHLEKLDLVHNHLSFLNISSCGSVGTVDLFDNNIEQITAETFNFVCSTDILYLTGNAISIIDYDVIATLRVRKIYFGSTHVTTETLKDLFIGISRSEIRELSITNMTLKVLPIDLFDPLRDYSLTVLTFEKTHMTAFYPSTFSNLTLLSRLILKYNKISTIDPLYFNGMQSLRILELNHNEIKRINPHKLTWHVGIVELHLSHNHLTEISSHTFHGLVNLTVLNLDSNEYLTVIEVTTFSRLDKLQTLYLSQCGISHLNLHTPVLKHLSLDYCTKVSLKPGVSFNHSQSLQFVDLTSSVLIVSNLWNITSNISLFDGLIKLEILNMSSNPMIFGFPIKLFRQLSTLQELHLSHCNLANLHPLLFVGLKSLRKLNLAGNKILHLRYDVFAGFDQVTHINLGENMLAYLDNGIFSRNSKLTTISLAGNKLTRLNGSTFINSSLTSIDISMNPIVCNCDLEWLFDWLKGPQKLINEDITICSEASLQPLSRKRLLDFDTDEFCNSNTGLYSLIPLAIICLVIIFVLIRHHRWHLRHKLFLFRLAALGYKQIADARDQNDYEFDLNIIYHDDDENWIREHLRPALEERLPHFQRNVFGDGDLVLGMHYLDAVEYAVTRSYKTIVVLSGAAVRDRWFMLKFRTAVEHVNDTQTEFVLVLFLEDNADELPFLARSYLNDGRPYLHWNNNLRGQEYFWNELVQYLNINVKMK